MWWARVLSNRRAAVRMIMRAVEPASIALAPQSFDLGSCLVI